MYLLSLQLVVSQPLQMAMNRSGSPFHLKTHFFNGEANPECYNRFCAPDEAYASDAFSKPATLMVRIPNNSCHNKRSSPFGVLMTLPRPLLLLPKNDQRLQVQCFRALVHEGQVEELGCLSLSMTWKSF